MSQSETLSRDERARILNEQRHMREALVSLTRAAPAAENRFSLLFRLLIRFELMAYPGAKHALQERHVSIHRFRMILDFFSRHLKSGAGP